MPSVGWSNREMLLCATIAFACGVFATAVWVKREEPTEAASTPAKPDEPKAGGPGTNPPPTAPGAGTKPDPDPVKLSPAEVAAAKLEKAHRGCKTLSRAVEAYCKHPANPGKTAEEKFPSVVIDLDMPPFGGPSFLPNGFDDFTDPWGKRYEFQKYKREDDTVVIVVFTNSPDGVWVTQYGVGVNAQPPALPVPDKKK